MSKTKTSPKAELINELIQLSQIRDDRHVSPQAYTL